jgi:hypothetical protein
MAEKHEDQKVHLTVQTLSGKYQHPFDPDDTLQFVINATLEHLHIQPQPGDVWELRYGEQLLMPSLTIRAAHIPDKAVLMLAPKEGGGGSA